MSANNTKKIGLENKVLLVSASGNLLIGVVGLTFAVVSSSQAILLDGLFNLTYFAMGLFTLKVAKLVQHGDDERFPFGYGFFEPLVNGIKGVLVLGVSIVALWGTLVALFTGGREIAAGLAVGYGIFASIFCWLTAWLTHVGAVKSASPLVRADADNWLVNAAISSCVLIAFGCIFLIRGTRLNDLIPYVDPIVVLTVVLISIGVPVRMAYTALTELLNRAPSPRLIEQVTAIIDHCTTELPVKTRYVRVIQPGRTRMVCAHLVLPPDYHVQRLDQFDNVRNHTQTKLQEEHPATVLDLIFITDEKWGKPRGIEKNTLKHEKQSGIG